MISGIYKLTFSSNKIYIGKSEDIKKRWEQHQASFLKGTHSKKMQTEYDRCGPPEYEIVLYAHADHVDIYESIYIQSNWGSNCLNGNRPRAITPEDAEKYVHYYNTLTINDECVMWHSSLMHLQAMEQYCKKLDEIQQELQLSQDDVEELETRGIKTPEGWREANNQLSYTNDLLDSENHNLNNECSRYHRELKRLQNLSWWDRLFNYKVYV